MRCMRCGAKLPKFVRTWYGSLLVGLRDKKRQPPVLGQDIPHQGIVREILSTRGSPGKQDIRYWTGQVGYRGRGRFCTLRCGYEWAMARIDTNGGDVLGHPCSRCGALIIKPGLCPECRDEVGKK